MIPSFRPRREKPQEASISGVPGEFRGPNCRRWEDPYWDVFRLLSRGPGKWGEVDRIGWPLQYGNCLSWRAETFELFRHPLRSMARSLCLSPGGCPRPKQPRNTQNGAQNESICGFFWVISTTGGLKIGGALRLGREKVPSKAQPQNRMGRSEDPFPKIWGVYSTLIGTFFAGCGKSGRS